MKYFVVADVHSFYDELITALNNQGFDTGNPEHILVSCGDAIDRGPKPKKVLQFLMDMFSKNRAILIRGNHCDLMEEAIDRHYFESHDYHNRTTETAEYITGKSLADYSDEEILKDMKINELWNSYINATIDYKEVGDYIFVHGWVPMNKKFNNGNIKMFLEEDWKAGDWLAARWFNGMQAWSAGNRIEGKTIVCGHYHTSWGHAYLHSEGEEFGPNMKTTPFIDEGIIALDACTAYSGQINCIILEVK